MTFLPLRVLGLAVAALTLTSLRAETPAFAIVYKTLGVLQTSATVQVPYRPMVGAEVDFSAPVAATTNVRLSGGFTSVALTKNDSSTFSLEQYYPDEPTLNAAWPDGQYSIITAGTGTTSVTPIYLTTSAKMTIPKITNFDALQAWSGSTLQITWEPILGATSDDFVIVSISRADGTEVYTSPAPGETGALDGTATSVTLNSITATSKETLYASVMYVRFVIGFANQGATITGAGQGFELDFPIIRAAAVKPQITGQPQSVTVAAGSTVAFNVVGAGVELTYQWRRNGVPISGATSPAYQLTNVQTANAGFFTVDVSNSSGTVTSDAVTLAIAGSSANPGRISNLSIRSGAGTGAQTLIVGFTVGGSGTSGTKPLLFRGVGPTLGTFGVPGVLADPRIELYRDAAKVGENDNWGSDAQAATMAAQVGAFALTASSGKDAAMYSPAITSGGYTLQISGNAGGTGVALAEIYDTTAPATFAPATPRLTNVSARTQVGTDASVLIAGFVVSGSTAKTLLIRAVGPTLGQFGVSGALLDPTRAVYTAAGTKIAENDNWGGTSALSTDAAAVGAFPLSVSSKDAALVITLPPGNYTTQVSGVNSTTGVGLVEIYEVP